VIVIKFKTFLLAYIFVLILEEYKHVCFPGLPMIFLMVCMQYTVILSMRWD